MGRFARLLRTRFSPRQRSKIRAVYGKLSHLVPKLPTKPKNKFKSLYLGAKKQLVDHFLSFGPGDLKACLRSLGIREGDTVLLHSSFDPFNGFQGSIETIINVFLQAIGADGNLLMVSLPYFSTTHEYLQHLECFDVNKTPSRMGMISEVFRRRKNVLRSLHPTHPVLAYGPKAEWIVAGHENALYPCGQGTPFEKLVSLDGKVVFFNARFTATFTFIHYLEDLTSDRLTFPIYYDEPFAVTVRDHQGCRRIVNTKVFTPEVIRRRWPEILEAELDRRKLIRRARIGNSRLLLVRTLDAIQCVKEMAEEGKYFYDLS